MSNLAHLLQRYETHPKVISILEQLNGSANSIRLQLEGLTGAQESFAIAAAIKQDSHKLARLHVVIASNKDEAAYRMNDLEGILGSSQVHFFPDSFKRPAAFEELNQTQILQRSETVSNLSAPKSGNVLVTYPEALFEKVVKPEILQESRIEVKKGERLDADFMIQVLVEYGFQRTDFVYEPGQFSVRGGIIDLFSFGNELPYRIELFDDEVETLRTFDPLTQLSRQNLTSLQIIPNLNTRFERTQKASLMHVLPSNAVVWIRDIQFLVDRLQYCFERAEQFASKVSALDTAELKEIFRDRAFLYPAEILEDLAIHPLLFLDGKMDQLRKNFPALF